MAEDNSPAQSPGQRIFSLCDKEGKGFVTKKDMLERMQNQLSLKPEQLEVVFDSLDSDGNGALTFEEFVQGFGVYLEEIKKETTAEVEHNDVESSAEMRNNILNQDVMRHMENLGAGEFLQNNDAVKQLAQILENRESEGLLENIFNRISHFVQSKEQERITMEDYMRQQIEIREEEHKKMYEEMELQITKEFKRIDLKGRMREAVIERDLTDEIVKKKQQIEQLSAREQELEETLSAVREGANAAKLQVAKLLKEKKFLEGQLGMQTRLADDLRAVCERLRRESVAERRQRAMAALAVAQDIAVERAGLVRQLHMLRAINTRLMDESDMRKWGSQSDQDTCEKSSVTSEVNDSILRQAEVDDEYQENDTKENGPSDENGQKESETGSESNEELRSKSLFDELSGSMALWQKPVGMDVTSQTEPCRIGAAEVWSAETQTDESTHLSEKTISVLNLRDRVSDEASETDCLAVAAYTAAEPHYETPCVVETSFASIRPMPTRVTNVKSFIGYHAGHWTHQVNLKRREVITPSNVYKIIVLGDVGVGKTSFVRRFCCGEFAGLANGRNVSGIDCSVRCLSIGNDQHIALQLWDAAGKNKLSRQRNIGRRLSRKADAVVVMYDITSEDSFQNARKWMSYAEEAADSAVRVLIGNKLDLLEPSEADENEETVECPDDGRSTTATVTRFAERVSTAEAMQLAESFGGHFYQTSAKSGYMVYHTLVAIAAKLLVKERIVMESIALDVDDEEEPASSDEGIKFF